MTTIAQFSIEYIQYLNPENALVQPLPASATHEMLLKLYKQMVFTRVFDTKAIALQRTGKMGTFPSSLGQEAVGVGIGYAMEKTDVFAPYYRDQATLMVRGVKPSQIYAYWGGDERGSNFTDAKEDMPTCVPIATQCLHAAGIAYAMQLRKQARAVLTICGEGGTSEGDFYEAINFAGTFKLPLVFIVNNNQWAISVPRSQQTGTSTIAQKAIAGGFEGIQVDGNDVIAVYEATRQALEKARKGGGPTLIEAMTYRLCDHTTADDAKRYVKKEDLEAAWQKEPVKRLRAYLESQKLWDESQETALQAQCTEEIAKSVEEYLHMPPQASTSILDYLYAKLPEAYQEQWEELSIQEVPQGH